MRKSMFPEEEDSGAPSSSEGEEQTSGSENGEGADTKGRGKKEGQKAPKRRMMKFRCAPKVVVKKKRPAGPGPGELFVLDTAVTSEGPDHEVVADEKEITDGQNSTEVGEKKDDEGKKESVGETGKGQEKREERHEKGRNLAAFDEVLKDKDVQELLAKSIIKPGFEKIYAEGHKPLSKRAEWRLRKAERESTKGAEWYGMPATELTEERQRDLQILQMRDALDTKTHYKRNDRSVLPKYFEVGTIIENKADFYSARLSKKQRKRTIVEELMADQEFQSKQRKKYDAIMAAEHVTRRGAFRRGGYPAKRGHHKFRRGSARV